VKWDFHHNRMPMTVLMLTTMLNAGLVINFLNGSIGSTGFVLNSIQIYALAGLELAGVIIAYVIGKRRTTTVLF
jgi:hypothetical protein